MIQLGLVIEDGKILLRSIQDDEHMLMQAWDPDCVGSNFYYRQHSRMKLSDGVTINWYHKVGVKEADERISHYHVG